jgi:DNA polymerase-1
MKRTLMIDGDILLFQVGRVTEDITDFGDEVLESYDMDSAIRLIEHELDQISKKTGYNREEMVFAISCTTNFRKRFFPTYKGNRKNVKKPLGLKAMRQYMLDNMEEYQTVLIEELEADDVLGMYATAPHQASGSEVAIYSQDKDLYTVPAKQWDFKKNKFIHPTPLESTKFLYTQVLTGDAVDGYKGCPKIGKVKAGKALAGCKDEMEMLAACHKLYFKVYGEEAKAKLLEQMGQARILHYADSQLLFMYDMLYNPYTMMEVQDEVLEVWEAS